MPATAAQLNIYITSSPFNNEFPHSSVTVIAKELKWYYHHNMLYMIQSSAITVLGLRQLAICHQEYSFVARNSAVCLTTILWFSQGFYRMYSCDVKATGDRRPEIPHSIAHSMTTAESHGNQERTIDYVIWRVEPGRFCEKRKLHHCHINVNTTITLS